MPAPEKLKTVETFEKETREATGLIITAYGGLKMEEFNEFRAKIRPIQAEYRVIKNSLTQIALRNAGFAELADLLTGPSAVVIERGDSLAAIKATFEFAKTHEKIKIKGGIFEGKFFDAQQLKTVASLPTRDVLLAHLLGTLQAPITNLVSVLQAPTRDFVNVLDAVAKKSEQK